MKFNKVLFLSLFTTLSSISFAMDRFDELSADQKNWLISDNVNSFDFNHRLEVMVETDKYVKNEQGHPTIRLGAYLAWDKRLSLAQLVVVQRPDNKFSVLNFEYEKKDEKQNLKQRSEVINPKYTLSKTVLLRAHNKAEKQVAERMSQQILKSIVTKMILGLTRYAPAKRNVVFYTDKNTADFGSIIETLGDSLIVSYQYPQLGTQSYTLSLEHFVNLEKHNIHYR